MIAKRFSTTQKIFFGSLVLILLAASYYFFAIYKSVEEITVHGSHVTYKTADELEKNADLVVLGTPLNNFEDREHYTTKFSDGAIQDFYTLTNIRIEKVIKTNNDPAIKQANTIKFVEPLTLFQTMDGKKKLIRDEYKEVKKGSKYIFYLKKNTFGNYSIINLNNGKFNTDNTDSKDLESDDQNEKNLKLSIKNDILKKHEASLK